jgi:predicted transposase YbfD/YdcC
MLFLEAFEDVPDPRDFTAQHELVDVLFVAFAAMLCGATACTDMALFAQPRLELLRQFVPLANGAPSHDTFSRLFRALDPKAFEAAFRRFMAAFGQAARQDAGPRHLAVDGKSLRRAYDKGRAHMPPLVVTVFACDTFMSLSQAVSAKGGEAACAIEALNLLSLKGNIVTGDALHCHRAMTEAVRERGGHYILAIKGNQSKLAKDATAVLDRAAANPRTRVHETEDKAHGRHEKRRAIVTAFTPSPSPKALVGLRAVARVEVWRTLGDDTTHQVRTYALSKAMPPDEVMRIVRNHWAIENNLHWQLDVLMEEDQTRNRKDNGPANLAALRRLALNVLQADPRSIPLSHKRLKARWENDELLRLMTHVR